MLLYELLTGQLPVDPKALLETPVHDVPRLLRERDVAGNAQFGIACSRAPQNRFGLLAFALLPAPGIPLLGIDLWVDPLSLLLSATVTSDAAGENVFALPLPAGALPTIHVQYGWIEDPALLTLSASDAMQIW